MYYIAIVTPEEINNQVLESKHYMRDRFECVVALKSPAHITLVPPFWMKGDLQEALEKHLYDFSIGKRRFEIELENYNAFKPRVIFVNVIKTPPLEELKLSLEDYLLRLQLFPITKETRPFHPHITIANRDLRKKDFYPAWEHFKNVQYQSAFTVDNLSLLRHTGKQWEIIFSTDLGKDPN